MLVVDQASLNIVMADANYKFKSKRFSFNGVNSTISVSVKNRYVAMLTSDAAHIVAFQSGIHIGHLIETLWDIYEIRGSDKIKPEGRLKDMINLQYGTFHMDQISEQKNKYGIFNTLKGIDPIVGKKTVRALDYILFRNGK
jgi:hypothetical protein